MQSRYQKGINMQHIHPEITAISTELFSRLTGFKTEVDLSTWAYRVDDFAGAKAEYIEGTFQVHEIPSFPAGHSVVVNFKVATLNAAHSKQTLLSDDIMVTEFNADGSVDKVVGERDASIADPWSKRTLQHCVAWRVADSVYILDGWYDNQD